MPDTLTPVIPAYGAARPRRLLAVSVMAAVAALHVVFGLLAQAAALPAPGPLAAPVDPAEPLMVLILPDSAGGGAVAGSVPAHGGTPTAPAARSRARNNSGAELDSRYLGSAKLDIGPMPAGSPDFAAVMNRPVFAGKVVLRVYVSGFGVPDRVEVLGKPLDEEFAQALRRALAQTSFLPGRLGGHDVAAYVDYEFQTELVVLPAPADRRNS